MSIVGGLDIHRKQLTFDCLGTDTGGYAVDSSPRPTAVTWRRGWAGSTARRRRSR